MFTHSPAAQQKSCSKYIQCTNAQTLNQVESNYPTPPSFSKKREVIYWGTLTPTDWSMNT